MRDSEATTPFPVELYGMLETTSKDNEMKDIVCWAPDGKGWYIRDRKAFVAKVMPIYFYRLKLNSFKRLLYAYGFKAILLKGKLDGATLGAILRSNVSRLFWVFVFPIFRV